LLNTGGSHSSVAEHWRISQQCCWALEDLTAVFWALEDLTAVLLSTGGSNSSVAEHWSLLGFEGS